MNMRDTEYARLCAYVNFDDDDRARLRALWPVVAPQAASVVDHFYACIEASEDAWRIFTGPDQVARLKRTLRQWLEEALSGPWDHAYVARRERIGQAHLRVGLQQHYMYTAMSVILDDVKRIARCALPPADVGPTCDALQRALLLDLALMNGSYLVSHEHRGQQRVRRVLLENLRATALVVGPSGEVVAGTRAAEALAGGDGLSGLAWQDVFPAELVGPIATAISARVETILPRIAVGRRTFLAHVVPLKDVDAAHLIQVEELTDTLNLEARVQRTETLAQLGTLAAAVAHEVRNPLAGISGALQVIAADSASHRHAGVMQKVVGEVHRLDQLVNELLSYARPTPAKPGPTDLRAAVDSALQLRNDLEIEVAVRGAGAGQADPDKLSQILLNLVNNAEQAGAARVVIEIEPDSIIVTDNGPGVPPALRDTLFDPFVTGRSRGTGLGLAISRQAADAMGGRLDLVPWSEGGGAAFRLELSAV